MIHKSIKSIQLGILGVATNRSDYLLKEMSYGINTFFINPHRNNTPLIYH